MTPASGPPAGCSVIVCRSSDDADALLDELRTLGADPIVVPLQRRAAPRDGGLALRRALDAIADYRWLVVTSANGVRAFSEALGQRTPPATLQMAAVGPATAAALTAAGFSVDLVAPVATAAHLAAAFPPSGPADAVLAPLAELASDDLSQGLGAKGYRVDQVEAYRMEDVTVEAEEATAVGRAVGCADAVLFTAPSLVDRFVEVFSLASVPAVTVCIGPRTAERARQHGIPEPITATEHHQSGLLRALVRSLAS